MSFLLPYSLGTRLSTKGDGGCGKPLKGAAGSLYSGRHGNSLFGHSRQVATSSRLFVQDESN